MFRIVWSKETLDQSHLGFAQGHPIKHIPLEMESRSGGFPSG